MIFRDDKSTLFGLFGNKYSNFCRVPVFVRIQKKCYLSSPNATDYINVFGHYSDRFNMQIFTLRTVHYAVIVAFLALSACTFNKLEDLEPKPPVDFCDSAAVTFSVDIVQILETNCTQKSFNSFGGSCHESGSTIADYTTYAGIKAKVDEGKLRQRAIVEASMPPAFSTGPRPDSTQLAIIQCWLDAGAPNN